MRRQGVGDSAGDAGDLHDAFFVEVSQGLLAHVLVTSRETMAYLLLSRFAGVNAAGWLCQENFGAVPLISAAEISSSHTRLPADMDSFERLSDDISIFPVSLRRRLSKPMHRTAEDKTLGLRGPPAAAHIKF